MEGVKLQKKTEEVSERTEEVQVAEHGRRLRAG